MEVEEIFRAYKNKVYRLALSITHNEKDAEDILQNTYLKIIKNLKTFRNESNLSTWIYRIAYNEALMSLRKRQSQSKIKDASGLFVNWSKLADEQLLDEEIKERVQSAIRQMPIKYRLALLLSNVEQLPIKESAKILGLKTNSLKTRLHRARLLIKDKITDYFKDRPVTLEKQSRKCNLMLNFVYDYALGELEKKRENAFSRHIDDCSNCKVFLDNYRKAIQITRALECQDLPDELQAKIETFLLAKQ